MTTTYQHTSQLDSCLRPDERFHVELIAPGVATAEQILLSHVVQLAALGYRSVICNRPDEEDGGQHPSHRDIAQACERHAMQFVYFPVHSSGHSEQEVRDMYEIVDAAPKPVLIYCRTGRRSRNLIASVEALQKSYHPESFG